MIFMEIFTKRLITLLKNKNLSYRKVSLDCGLSASAVGSYINDGKKPTIETLSKIASYLSVSSDYLLGLSEDVLGETTIQVELSVYKDVVKWVREIEKETDYYLEPFIFTAFVDLVIKHLVPLRVANPDADLKDNVRQLFKDAA